MKNLVLILLIISVIATPVYAVNVVDTVLCKKVFLFYNRTYILVNRVTGEVKYRWTGKGQWVPLTGVVKNQYQAIYNAQVAAKKP
jgi:hypothetical protein